METTRLGSREDRPSPATVLSLTPGSGGQSRRARPLRAHLNYDPDGALLFHLSGQEEIRFARVLEDFRRAVPLADREWVPELDAWVLYGGWDEELLELLADHFEPSEVFVNGQHLGTEDDE